MSTSTPTTDVARSPANRPGWYTPQSEAKSGRQEVRTENDAKMYLEQLKRSENSKVPQSAKLQFQFTPTQAATDKREELGYATCTLDVDGKLALTSTTTSELPHRTRMTRKMALELAAIEMASKLRVKYVEAKEQGPGPRLSPEECREHANKALKGIDTPKDSDGVELQFRWRLRGAEDDPIFYFVHFEVVESDSGRVRFTSATYKIMAPPSRDELDDTLDDLLDLVEENVIREAIEGTRHRGGLEASDD